MTMGCELQNPRKALCAGFALALGICLAVSAGSDARAAEAPAPLTTATAVAARPTTPGTGSDPAAIKWLRTLEERHRDHQRALGEFRQTKEDPVFLEKIQASGTFYYERPNRFRCDYEKPEKEKHWVIGDMVTSYFPDLKQVERYRVSSEGSGIGEVNHMLLAFGIETDKILKHFIVKEDPASPADEVRLTFVPKARREERPFAHFTLRLSKPDLTPKSFLIVGEENDRTSVTVENIKWNWDPKVVPNGQEIFSLKFPADVEIIEP